MLQSIEFTNFKGIVEGKVDLSQFTILIGRNNSGKSTILEAINLLPSPFSVSEIDNEHKINEILRRHTSSHNPLVLLNYYVSERARIHYTFSEGEFGLDIINDRQNSRVGFELYSGSQREHVGHMYYSGGFIGIENPIERKYDIKTLLIEPFVYTIALQSLRDKWIEFANLGILREVAITLSKLANEDYIDLVNEPFMNEQDIYFYLSNGKRVRVGDVGSGLQELFIAMTLIKKIKPSIIMWDDIECYMHPSLLVFTLDWLKDLAMEGKQIIITTHSLDVINVASELLDEFESFSVKFISLKDNKLSYKDLKSEDIKSLKEANVDVRLADVIL